MKTAAFSVPTGAVLALVIEHYLPGWAEPYYLALCAIVVAGFFVVIVIGYHKQ